MIAVQNGLFDLAVLAASPGKTVYDRALPPNDSEKNEAMTASGLSEKIKMLNLKPGDKISVRYATEAREERQGEGVFVSFTSTNQKSCLIVNIAGVEERIYIERHE